MDLNSLRQLYDSHQEHANAVLSEVRVDLEKRLRLAGIRLAMPLESRVKSWESFIAKIEQFGHPIERISELQDFAGLRATFLFSRDVTAASELVERHFSIRRVYDTGDRLGHDQFGYTSLHYVLKPATGLVYDSTGLPEINPVFVELQLRTMSQHTWAAVSHRLQYKQERDVPDDVRRGLHRAAALLELVDLEFERLLSNREAYGKRAPATEDSLNVDSLRVLLDSTLPIENRADEGEPYADLLHDLAGMGVTRSQQVNDVIKRHLNGVLAEEARLAAIMRKTPETSIFLQGKARYERGVVLTHAGLLRIMLQRAFDRQWDAWMRKKRAANERDA